MNTQIFHSNNLISMTSKVIEGPKSSSNFSVNPTLPLMDGPLMLPHELCVFLFLSLYICSLFPFISLTLSLYPSLPLSFAPCKISFIRVIFNDFQSFHQITTLFFGYASIPIIPTFFA